MCSSTLITPLKLKWKELRLYFQCQNCGEVWTVRPLSSSLGRNDGYTDQDQARDDC